jgi:Zn-dependent oligopeptidase
MKTAAREAEGLPVDTLFRSWDFRYYTHAQMEAMHQVSMDEVKEYFPLNSVLTKMFSVYERIFGLQVCGCHMSLCTR